MNYNNLEKKVLEVYQKCQVKGFPINCFHLLESYNYECIPYSSLPIKRQKLYISYTDDAFIFMGHRKLFYNDRQQETSIRFSLMHELGHIVLKHHPEKAADWTIYEIYEAEAEAFASLILAPNLVIHKSGCHNAADIAQKFKLPESAAKTAMEGYALWCLRYAQIYDLSKNDHLLYEHFYDHDHRTFVFKRKRCNNCEREYVNSDTVACPECQDRFFKQYHPMYVNNHEPASEEQDLTYGHDL